MRTKLGLYVLVVSLFMLAASGAAFGCIISDTPDTNLASLLHSFGADAIGHLDAANAGISDFVLDFDGSHSPLIGNIALLLTGLHSFTINFNGPGSILLVLFPGASLNNGSLPVPEPSLFLLLGAGILGIGIFNRKRIR